MYAIYHDRYLFKKQIKTKQKLGTYMKYDHYDNISFEK